jgi:hypothetical protein
MFSLKNNGSEHETDHYLNLNGQAWNAWIFISAPPYSGTPTKTGTKKPTQAMALQTSVPEATGLNLDWDTVYPD